MAEPRYVNLTAPAGGYESQLANIKRRQKMAELLAQQGGEDIKVESVNGVPTPISPFQGLAKALQSGMGGYLAGKASEDEAALKKAGLAEAKDARKSFYTLDDTTMPGGKATLFAPTLGGSNMPSAPPPGNMPLPNYIAQDAEAMAAGPAAAQPGDLRPFDIRPTEQKATFGDITTKGLPRSREDQSRLLDEYEMSDNPYLQNLSQRLRAESKGQMFEGNKAGVYRLNANGEIETVVPASTEVGDTSKVAQLISERNKLAPDDPNRSIYDAAINMETTRAPGVSVSVGAEKPFAKALGTGAAGVLEASSNAARGGVKSLGTIAQMRNALKTGKVNLGPGASITQLWQQMTGGDPTRINNTRSITQGLAQLTLNARGSLKGQGTITDREQELLEKAVSATSIDSLTISELNEILAVAERAANFSIDDNEVNVNRARKIPGASEVIDFYSVSRPKSFNDILNTYPGKP